jgi:hypothetical protein
LCASITPPPAWLLWGIGCTGFGDVVVDEAMKHPLQAHTAQLVNPTQYPYNLLGYKFIC